MVSHITDSWMDLRGTIHRFYMANVALMVSRIGPNSSSVTVMTRLDRSVTPKINSSCIRDRIKKVPSNWNTRNYTWYIYNVQKPYDWKHDTFCFWEHMYMQSFLRLNSRTGGWWMSWLFTSVYEIWQNMVVACYVLWWGRLNFDRTCK